MRRRPRQRVASALLGTWFALFSVAPSSWRPCPDHGLGGEMAHGAMTHGTMAHGTMHMAPGPECEHAAAAASAPTKAPRHQPTHPCDCPPSCGMVSTVARVERPAVLSAVLVVVKAQVVPRTSERAAPERPRLLPFASGPPPPVLG